MPQNAITPSSPVPTLSRLSAIALCVVLLHAGLLYAVYRGPPTRKAEVLVPIVMLAQMVEPPEPPKVVKAEPPPPPALPSVPIKKPVLKPSVKAAPAPAPISRPSPAPISESAPAPTAPSGDAAPQAPPTRMSGSAEPGTATPGGSPGPPGPPSNQSPSSNADYLQNPKPAYPPISRRLNEQGRTTVRVLIGADGLPQRAEIAKSSGFSRLDDAALATVMRWRYVPGRRNGVAEAMWFNVPINWVLE